VEPVRLAGMLSEMARVATSGGTVMLAIVTTSSFGEFFSVYWEALQSAGLHDHSSHVENLITELPTCAALEEVASQAGLRDVISTTKPEVFAYDSGEDFMNSPLITDFFLPRWTKSLVASDRSRICEEIVRFVDEERKDGNFILSVKATLIVGRK
jgi:hypothetical protein